MLTLIIAHVKSAIFLMISKYSINKKNIIKKITLTSCKIKNLCTFHLHSYRKNLILLGIHTIEIRWTIFKMVGRWHFFLLKFMTPQTITYSLRQSVRLSDEWFPSSRTKVVWNVCQCQKKYFTLCHKRFTGMNDKNMFSKIY